MRDPYSILGVRRNADQEEIKTAWRSLAKAVHPDQNQDDPFATIRFTEAGRAYELLRDPERRNRYDRALREAQLRRMEQMRRQQSERKDRSESPAGETAKAGEETAEDMIARIFGVDARQKPEQKPEPQQQPQPAAQARASESQAEPQVSDSPDEGEKPPVRGLAPAAEIISAIVRRIRGVRMRTDKAPDLVFDVVVTVEDIVNRAKASVELADGQTLKVPLGPGTTEGQTVRLRDQGHRINDLKRGDAVATVRVAPGRFRVDGFDLRTELAITIENAVLGCETVIEGPTGAPLPVTVPAWSGSDQTVRIEGEGLTDEDGNRGALIVEIRLLLWEKPDDKMIDLMRSLREGLYL